MSTTEGKLLLTIPQVCEMTGFSRSLIYLLLDKPGGIPAIRIGRTVRVTVHALEQWIESHHSEALAEKANCPHCGEPLPA